ncbi:GntR family transcriptional regulator [Microterricola gilva]|uniref:GntR family transcriptional regulator n=1 Tax=Microterricola gilva TaxID=393267 RepID=A0A4Q8AHL0_9MICO|nr:GntR family transcriptional regulator [Microterricola gilva]RZU63848.1 GntR family transcriptional regulator [Microterricola gilva]
MSDAGYTSLSLDRGLLSDRVYALIKTSIRDGSFEPGAQLVESQLARELQVSQAPVREALKRLIHEGVVTHVPHRGSFVTTFSAEEAEQARTVRIALEGLAASLACGHLTDVARTDLESVIEQMHDAASAGDIARFRELDLVFHRTVIEQSGNIYLPRMWEQIEPSLRALHVLSDPNFGGDWHAIAETHRGLLSALDGTEPEGAAQAFRAHADGHALTAGPAAD